jgi:hypothetical protein
MHGLQSLGTSKMPKSIAQRVWGPFYALLDHPEVRKCEDNTSSSIAGNSSSTEISIFNLASVIITEEIAADFTNKFVSEHLKDKK